MVAAGLSSMRTGRIPELQWAGSSVAMPDEERTASSTSQKLTPAHYQPPLPGSRRWAGLNGLSVLEESRSTCRLEVAHLQGGIVEGNGRWQLNAQPRLHAQSQR